MTLSIVVDVKQPGDTCFVITPFLPEFGKLSDLIIKASRHPNVNLKGLRADDLPKGDEFPKAVVEEIRSAHLVVAVCSSSSGTGQLNGNVFYELGLASSLRKPILILTTEEDKPLPSDIGNITYMTYRWDGLDHPEFLPRLINEMAAVRRAASSGLTDARFDDTRCFPQTLRAKCWQPLREIIQSTVRVHQDLAHAHGVINPLCESAHVIFGKRGRDLTDFILRWHEYRSNRARPLLSPLKKLVEEYRKFLDPASGCISAARTQNTFKVQEFFNAVEHQVDEFEDVHERVDGELTELLRRPSKETQGKAYNDSTQIPSLLDILMNNLYALLWNVLGTVATTLEEEQVPVAP